MHDLISAFKIYAASVLSFLILLWEWYLSSGNNIIATVMGTLTLIGTFIYILLGIKGRWINNKLNRKKLNDE